MDRDDSVSIAPQHSDSTVRFAQPQRPGGVGRRHTTASASFEHRDHLQVQGQPADLMDICEANSDEGESEVDQVQARCILRLLARQPGLEDTYSSTDSDDDDSYVDGSRHSSESSQPASSPAGSLLHTVEDPESASGEVRRVAEMRSVPASLCGIDLVFVP